MEQMIPEEGEKAGLERVFRAQLALAGLSGLILIGFGRDATAGTEQGQQATDWVEKVGSEQGQPKLCAEGVLDMLRHFMRQCGHVPQPE